MRRGSVLVPGLAALLLFVPAGHALAADAPAPLTPGKPIEREIAVGAVDAYSIKLKVGEVLRGVVEQKGIDLVVRVLDPAGAVLAEIDSPNGSEGPEPIDVEAKAAGLHVVEVRPLGEGAQPGRYEIRIDRVLSAKERAAELAAIEARHGAAVDWLKTHAIPLATVRAGSGFEDLAPVREIVGNARVVALGEATHGTREFFQMKHRMLEFLVSEAGFTAFGIEATLPEALDVDRYVVTGEGDPARALAGLYFWTWNTEEVMDLLEWMRAWNADASHPRKIHFYGFDMQAPTRAAKLALEALAQVDRKACDALRPRLDLVTSAYEASNLGRESQGERDALLSAARDLESALGAHKAALQPRLGEEATARVLRCARVLVQCAELRASDANDSNGIRDRSMAENALWALEQEGPAGKIVLWAHNGHVSTSPLAMGSHLRSALGNDLRVFGFAFYEGAFQAIDWPPPGSGLTTFVAPPAPPGTLDAALAEAGLDFAAIDLRALPREGPVAEWFGDAHGTRSIGAIGSPMIAARAFNTSPVRDDYDALLFVKKTSAARAMASGARRQRRPLAEASNLSFERGDVDAVPADWGPMRWGEDAFGYEVRAREVKAAEGMRALSITGLAGRRYGDSYGSASQTLLPEKFRGKHVRVAGSIRTEGSIEAHLSVVPRLSSLTAWGAAGSAKVRGVSKWQRVVAEADIPKDALSVTLEVGAEGVGTAWFDDLQVEVVGDAAPAAEAAN